MPVKLHNNKFMMNFGQIGASASGIILEPGFTDVLKRTATLGNRNPSPGQQKKLSTLYRGISDDGDLSNLDVFFSFMNDGSKEFGAVNWKHPADSLASYVSSPVWTSNQGVSSNGVGYINSNYNPSTYGGNFTQNSCSIGLFFYAGAVSNGVTAVLWSVSDTIYCYDDPGITNRFVCRMNSSNATSPLFGTATDVVSGKMYSAKRSSSSTIQCFIDGSSDSTPSSTSVAVANANLQFLSVNGLNIAPSGWKLAFAWAGNGSVNHLNIRNRINTFFSSP
jgi:hypothetical protein